MNAFTTLHPVAYVQHLRSLPSSEDIYFIIDCRRLNRVRIGKFALPCQGNSVYVVPPYQSCTLNIKSTDKVLCFRIPLGCLDKIKMQQLLFMMYHRPLLTTSKNLVDMLYASYTNDGDESLTTSALTGIISEIALNDFVLNPVCSKIIAEAKRFLNYIASCPCKLDYLNVSTAAVHLQHSARTLQRISNCIFGMPVHSIFGHHLAMEGVNRVLYQGQSVREAAKEIGYSAASAYHKSFKAQLGVAHSEFLKLITEKL